MNSQNFAVMHRPRLAEITSTPRWTLPTTNDVWRRSRGRFSASSRLISGHRSGRSLCLRDGIPPARAALRRLGWALDPRSFKVHPIAAPDEHERAQHYLQRFWRRLPEKGQIVVFDRSWYGRVLVERVEGLATDKEWRRAYREINEFELMLVNSGFALSSCSCTSRPTSRCAASAAGSLIQ